MRYRPKQQVVVNLGTRDGKPVGCFATFVQPAGKKKLLLRGSDGARFEARNEDVHPDRQTIEAAVPGIVFPSAGSAGTSAPPRHSPTSIKGGYSKRQIADAVHHAVCEVTQSDGFGHCMKYAICGTALLARLGYPNPIMQAGMLSLSVDPSDPGLHMTIDPSRGHAEEIHCWVALFAHPAPEGMVRVNGEDEIVDFSGRHYRDYIDRLDRAPDAEPIPITWGRGEPPAFVWGARADRPHWIHHEGQLNASIRLFRSADVTEAKLLQRLALEYLSAQTSRVV